VIRGVKGVKKESKFGKFSLIINSHFTLKTSKQNLPASLLELAAAPPAPGTFSNRLVTNSRRWMRATSSAWFPAIGSFSRLSDLDLVLTGRGNVNQ